MNSISDKTKTCFAVNGLPIGQEMYRSKKYGGLTTSPIVFTISEGLAKKLVKVLVSTMIAYDPAKRPTADDVVNEMEIIIRNLPHL